MYLKYVTTRRYLFCHAETDIRLNINDQFGRFIDGFGFLLLDYCLFLCHRRQIICHYRRQTECHYRRQAICHYRRQTVCHYRRQVMSLSTSSSLSVSTSKKHAFVNQYTPKYYLCLIPNYSSKFGYIRDKFTRTVTSKSYSL